MVNKSNIQENFDEDVKNVCIGTEANFSVFIKTDMSPIIKIGAIVLSISIFTSVIGGLNPIAYDSIVIGVGICLGFMLFTNIISAADLREMLKNALAPQVA